MVERFTVSIQRNRSFDADEYRYAIKREKFLSDALDYQKDVNDELAAENRELAADRVNLSQRIEDNENGIAEQARLLREVRDAAAQVDARLCHLELELQNLTHWMREEYERGKGAHELRRDV
ncbi:MAG: hypothetical protein GX580_13045 [Candidatus Hydrogenedens sp.]|nr:hypothetical protein [Candidatus Hydrogenedens sp.]